MTSNATTLEVRISMLNLWSREENADIQTMLSLSPTTSLYH